jgi:ATP-dependent DNA helicase RecG
MPEQMSLIQPSQLETLTTRREDQWFERKGSRTQPRAIAEAMVGMANAEGGTIVVGISDEGKVEGLRPEAIDRLRKAALDLTEPPVRHRVDFVAASTKGGEDVEIALIALIELESSDVLHRMTSGEIFLRVADETRRLRDSQARELEYDKGQSAYDGQPVRDAQREDLDAELVTQYASTLGVQGNVDDALEARGLLVRKSGSLVPTVAGILLLCAAPQQFFPEAWIRVVEYEGQTRLTGARANVTSDRRFEGPLSKQLEEASAYLQTRVPRAIRLGAAGRFQEVSTIPEHAWLEAVVNALIHRSYSLGGDHIRVDLFRDRIEVESPGRLPGLVREDNIRSTRFARNPRLARAMSDLGYGRELGEGVDRMFEEMELAGLPDPKIEQRPASVVVTLLANPELARLLRTLPQRLAKSLEVLTQRRFVSTRELMEAIGVSRPTALKYLAELERLELVEHYDRAPKDPYGYWGVKKF